MELHADEPRMLRELDDLRQALVGRHAGEDQAAALEAVAVRDVHLVAMTMALRDRRRAVDRGDLRARPELARIGAEAHRTAEVVALAASLDCVALHPLGEKADHRLGARAELRRARVVDAGDIAREL